MPALAPAELRVVRARHLSLRADVEAAVADKFLVDADLRALTPAPVTEAEAAQARAAWEAFTGDDPRAWAEVNGEGALRFVPAAMRRLAEELPWTTDGLTRSQRQLRAAHGDFARSQATEEAAFLGDSLAALLVDEPSEWLGGVRTDGWRWDPAREVASPV
ncbi:MAG TPA: hypothetical protein VGW10_03660 [Solirubrobacteraceae bacterium]|nr:hypothetical protein [Solirubrobacteraceae bacterium]